MKNPSLLAAILLLVAFNSCKTQQSADETAGTTSTFSDSAVKMADEMLQSKDFIDRKGGITLSYFTGSPDFPDATLISKQPGKDQKVNPGKVMFQYEVKNFELTKQTEGGGECHCANSKQGQHIHNILNNTPYTAHYTDTFSKVLTPGHYIDLSFLSRSYHESIKHKTAYQLTQFDIGPASKPVDLTGPLMFYSRPKGEYAGDDTKRILLDFYLVNTDLSESGNKVRATINGNEFMLTKWAPYALEGLPMGENKIKLELLDKDNNPIPGPYNVVERTITLK